MIMQMILNDAKTYKKYKTNTHSKLCHTYFLGFFFDIAIFQAKTSKNSKFYFSEDLLLILYIGADFCN